MDRDEMRDRTKKFALRIVRLASTPPASRVGDVLGRQILKSGTSIAANHAEALRASSKRRFISILEISSREAAETLYWLELLTQSGTIKAELLTELTDECSQLVAILTATGRTAKRNK